MERVISVELGQAMTDNLSSKTRSAEARQKQRLATLGEKNHFFGNSHTAETKRKISDARRGTPAWNYGKEVGPTGPGTGGFNKRAACDFCLKETTAANLERHRSSCPLNPVNLRLCLQCRQPIMTKRTDNQLFCSGACHYAHRLASNQSRSRECCICGKGFEFDTAKRGYFRKTCSESCLSLLIGQNSTANPNCGARAHFARSQRCQYKGVLMDSAWEVALAQWLDGNGIEWTRSRETYFRWTDQVGKSRRYTPDFYLPELDCYLDPKNSYLMKVDAAKMRQVRNKHGIQLICGSLPYVKARISQLRRAGQPK